MTPNAIRRRNPLTDAPPPFVPSEWAALAFVLIAGAFVRFWNLEQVPGLWYDEAIYGLDSLRVLREPGWPIFFTTGGHMREPLYMYLQAISLGLFGVSVETLRGTSAVIGTLTILPVWWLGREVGGRRTALLVALLFAFLRWHLHFSQLAFRVILSPVFPPLIVVFLIRTLRGRKPLDAALCGALIGASLYTYLSLRLFAVAALLMGLWGAFSLRMPWRQAIRLAAIIAVCALLVFLPLGVDYLRNPEHFTGRQEEVWRGSQILPPQTRDVALMYAFRGDHVGKHNIPGPPRFWQPYLLLGPDPERTLAEWQDASALGVAPDQHGTGFPVFDLLTGLLFYAGVAFCLWGALRRRWQDAMPLLWIGVGSFASILSFGAPNLLRLLLLTPAVVLVLARGAETLADWSAGQLARASSELHSLKGGTGVPPVMKDAPASLLPEAPRPRPALALLAAFVLWFAAGETARHQLRWHGHPMAWPEFNPVETSLAHFLAEAQDRPPVILIPSYLADHPSLAFIADGVTGLVPVKPETLVQFPAGRSWIALPSGPLPPLAVPNPRAEGLHNVADLRLPNGQVVFTIWEKENGSPHEGGAVPENLR